MAPPLMVYPGGFGAFGQSIFGKLVLLQILRDSVTDRGERRTLCSSVGAGAFELFCALVIDIGARRKTWRGRTASARCSRNSPGTRRRIGRLPPLLSSFFSQPLNTSTPTVSQNAKTSRGYPISPSLGPSSTLGRLAIVSTATWIWPSCIWATRWSPSWTPAAAVIILPDASRSRA